MKSLLQASIKENEKSVVDEVVLEADEDRITCTEFKVSGKEHEVLLSEFGEGDPNICLMDIEEIAVQYQDSVDGQHFLHAGKALEDQSTNQGDCRKEFTKEILQVLLEADEAQIACTDVMISDKEHEVLLSDFGDVDPNICLDTEEIAVRYQDSVDGQIFLHAGKALEDQSTNQGDCWKEFTKEKLQVLLEADEVLLEADEAQISCSEVMVSGKEHEVMLSDFGDGVRNICLIDTEEIAVRYQDSVDHQHFLHAGKALEDQSTNQDSVVSQHFLHAGNALEDQSTNQGDCWKVFTEEKFEKDCSLCTPDSSKTLHHDAYLNNYSESIPEFEVFRFSIPTMIESETNNYSDLSCLKEQIVSLLDKLRKCERDVNSGSRNELTGGEKMESGEKGCCAPPVSESRESTDAEPFREMSSKPELPRKDIQRTRSQNCTGFKNNENAPRHSKN